MSASDDNAASRQEDLCRVATTETRLHAVLEAAVDAIISSDEHGTIQLCNPAAERLFGYDADQLVGRNVSMLIPAPYHEEHDSYVTRHLATGERHIIGIGREVVGLRQDGTIVPIELSVAEAKVGSERLFVGTIRDISDRQRTDQRFRLVAESTPNSIVMVNADGVIIFVNSQAELDFGYHRTEMVGQLVEMLVPERSRGRHPFDRQAFFASPAARPMGAGRDLFARRKDGSEFPVEIGLTPIQTAEGPAVISAIVDITERRRGETAVREQRDHLARLVAELQTKNEEVRTATQQLWIAAKLASVGELAASIAHELNNPLAIIILRLESLLARTSQSDTTRKALEIIDQEARRMGNLVANLLQFSRRSQEQISTVDVCQELAKAVELVHHLLKNRQILIHQDLKSETPTIYADRQKLRQVFLNLLTNASDAMERGGQLSLTISRDVLPDGSAAVRIEVTDTGGGIPDAHLAKVFDPFFTTKEEGRGTGLGLAICRRVVDEHQGEIRIDSEVGKGTTVTILLPVNRSVNAERVREVPNAGVTGYRQSHS